MSDEYIRKADAMEVIGEEYVPRTDFERGMASQLSCDKAKIKALPSADVVPVEILKAEIYKLKHQSEQGFGNHDYYVGYISALSMVEGVLAVIREE